MNRRTMLKTVAVAGAAATFPVPSLSQSQENGNWHNATLRYLESLAHPDGGYGWEGQAHSHLTPTFHVIGCYRLLNLTPPKSGQLAEFIRTHHPSVLKKLEQERRIFDFQQVQALIWLGEDAARFKPRILSYQRPLAYLRQYEQHGYPLFSSEIGIILSRGLLGVPAAELPSEFIAYLDARRRANGSFNNTPAEDESEGHILNTWWGLRALLALGRPEEKKKETIAWLGACQLPNGAFTFQPRPEFGGVDDVAYTWAAVRALQSLGESPKNTSACLAYLQSLANSDGGFADRPGWLSNPMATYYALDALDALDALKTATGLKRRPTISNPSLPSNLQVFSIQLEAHGEGSPAEAVDLARSLRIHWWGAKNPKPGWLARAQAIADHQKAPVKFFVANEEYGTWINIPGLGTYSHMSDILAPADASTGAPLVGQSAVSWPDFRRKRLAPLEQVHGRLIWQFGENEELVRMLLDDSVEQGGYAAISTYHFGNPDFTNSEPFLHRWRRQIPFVALQDAHGPEPWWFSDMTTGFRTVFLATEPTWESWLQALKNNWVAAIRHDSWSAGQTWMHAGSPEVLGFVRAHERDWRWWDNPLIQRPLISIVAVRPEDEFEVARPEKGIRLRVRCAWENTTQGLPKNPIAELVRLVVDGAPVEPALIEIKQARGSALLDHYHQYHLPDPGASKYAVTAVARVMRTGEESIRTINL